ncbi:MAG: MoaD/ThiS family protein [Anaerolineae bacterium]|nr:MoaD/ThiS family protein [Anaerolineae bacterium]
MATLKIPSPLRPYAEGVSEIKIEAGDVAAALETLTSQYPALRTHLFSDSGELRAFVNLFLNDEDIRHLDGPATLVKEGDRLMIVPSIAGGGRG